MDSSVCAIVVFTIQYVFVNYVLKYKLKHGRWKITTKGNGISFYELKETEGLQDAMCSALEIVYYLLADLLKGSNLTALPFIQTVLSSSSRPNSVSSAIVSLMNIFPSPAYKEVGYTVGMPTCIPYSNTKNDGPSLLLPMTSEQDGGSTSTVGDVKSHHALEPRVYPSFSGQGSVFDSILKYVKTSEILMNRYCCQGVVLEIMARETFLQEKFIPNESSKIFSSTTNGHVENILAVQASPSSTSFLNDILTNWYDGSTIDALIKLFALGGYDTEIINHAKIASCMLIVHLLNIMRSGSTGCLSMLLVEKIHMIHDKVAFDIFFFCSDGEKAISLVLHDLYYHLKGALEGRGISSGPFQELSQLLLDLEIFQYDENNCAKDLWRNNIPMYDIASLRGELGIDLWDMSGWKTSKEMVETMLSHMHKANLMISLADSKNFALKALVAVISVINRKAVLSKSSQASGGISDSFLDHSIRYVCRCVKSTEDLFVQVLKTHEKLLELLSAQAEMLLVLSRIFFSIGSQRKGEKRLPISLVLIRICGSCSKLLSDVRPSATLQKAVKLFLMLLLVSMESSHGNAYINDDSDLDANQVAEASLAVARQLVILCKYIQKMEYFDLSVASMDIILKRFLTPSAWLPVLQENLHIHNLILLIRQTSSLVSISITLNFCLTLARIKCGAEMLHSVGIFPALEILLNNLVHGKHNIDALCSPSNYNKDEKHVVLLELGLAIITSVVFHVHDDSNTNDIFDSVVCNFFTEKPSFVSACLSAPSFSIDDRNKQTQNQVSQTSLTALNLAEQSLLLICMLAMHPNYRRKGMREMDLELKQKIIHLLAFISRDVQRVGDTSSSTIPFFCLPILKEEAELNEKPSVISCKHGWFMVSAFGVSSKVKRSSLPKPEMSLVPKDPTCRDNLAQPTHFSDIVAIQVYRIAFLLLSFLCMQAKVATERAEEVGFIDLDRFPDLPMPDILHGLQDQAIAIVKNICEANSSSVLQADAEGVCLLLLQILEKSLYLEFCVTQSCGIRPVLGRVEDFSRETKLLIQGVEKYTNLKASLSSLRKIMTLLYPGLLQTSSSV
ncbi:hypothetical protein AXF42_Ash007700 [Apostasia shenzhenica]|uniref:Uncharacterized protein n=1 Tax=Apostasia shenzhenica TaxID=1088818 RepID=A0A2I0A681_9ASPA|nr:hypothetical protein AXF42_Ash007700 [Apostasia shenzhenica]